jgi:hypothetical protein
MPEDAANFSRFRAAVLGDPPDAERRQAQLGWLARWA